MSASATNKNCPAGASPHPRGANLYMKYILATVFLFFSIFSTASALDKNLELKTDEANITNFKIDEKKPIVEYQYKTEEAGRDIGENIDLRTDNSQTFPLGNNQIKKVFYSGKHFFHDTNTDIWYNVRTATTTLEAWNTQVKDLSLFNFFVKTANASDYYSGSGDGTCDNLNDGTFTTTREGVSCNNLSGVVQGMVGHYSSNIRRGFITFDTSDLPDDSTILTASLFMDNDGSVGSPEVALIQTTQADPEALAVSDYSALTLNSAPEGASRRSSFTSGYDEWEFNTTGKGWISKTGFTKLGLREAHDMDNSDPSGGSYYIFFWYSSPDAPAGAPKLSITYEEGAPPAEPPAVVITDYLPYIDDFTIDTILFIHWLILATAVMYFGSALFSYFLRAIFGVKYKRKKDEKN